MHAAGDAGKVAVDLEVIQQVHAEVIESEVGDGDAGLQVFHLDDFLFQAAELLLAVGEVIGFAVEDVMPRRPLWSCGATHPRRLRRFRADRIGNTLPGYCTRSEERRVGKEGRSRGS